MKKGFISIYVLLILLAFGLTISFIYKENETNFDSVSSLYYKKFAMYEAESALNIIMAEKKYGKDINNDEFLDKFNHKSKLEITRGNASNNIKEAEGAKVIIIRAVYEEAISKAILTYKEDVNKKPIIIYKRVY